MEKAVSITSELDPFVPVCVKVAAHKIIEVCGQFYFYVENVYGDTYLFKIILYVKPSQTTKEMIESILGGYMAWFKFEGNAFPSPFRIGIIWITTFKKCIGCSTKEMCADCILAAINTFASCFPGLLPPKVMWYFSGILSRLAYDRSLEAELLKKQERLVKLLLGGTYGQI